MNNPGDYCQAPRYHAVWASNGHSTHQVHLGQESSNMRNTKKGFLPHPTPCPCSPNLRARRHLRTLRGQGPSGFVYRPQGICDDVVPHTRRKTDTHFKLVLDGEMLRSALITQRTACAAEPTEGNVRSGSQILSLSLDRRSTRTHLVVGATPPAEARGSMPFGRRLGESM